MVSGIVFAAQPFGHGIWLIAYLVLVGFLAQLLLGFGQTALIAGSHAAAPTARMRAAQLALWNAGVIAVPFGVLVESRLAVLAGSVALLSALACFFESVRPALSPGSYAGGWRSRSYVLLLTFMAASVLVGASLAWDIRWL